MSMEEDEKAAVNWAADNYTNTTSFGAYGIKKEAFLVGASHGRKRERARIMQLAEKAQREVIEISGLRLDGCVTIKQLEGIIFGGEGEKCDHALVSYVRYESPDDFTVWCDNCGALKGSKHPKWIFPKRRSKSK